MLSDEVQDLLEELRSNSSLREEFTETETVEEVVELARDRGYDVTAEDYEQFQKSRENGQLSDEELEQVAGGKLDADPDRPPLSMGGCTPF